MTIACSLTHSRAGEETTGVLVRVREFEPSSVNLERDANAKIGDVVKGRRRRMLGRRCIDRFFHARAFEKFTRRALLGRLFEYRQRLIADVETNDELTRHVEFVHDVAVSVFAYAVHAFVTASRAEHVVSYCTTSFKRSGRTTCPPPKMMDPVRQNASNQCNSLFDSYDVLETTMPRVIRVTIHAAINAAPAHGFNPRCATSSASRSAASPSSLRASVFSFLFFHRASIAVTTPPNTIKLGNNHAVR